MPHGVLDGRIAEMVVFQSLFSLGNVWCGSGGLKITAAAARLARARALVLASALLQLQPAQQGCRTAEVQQLLCQGLQLCQFQQFWWARSLLDPSALKLNTPCLPRRPWRALLLAASGMGDRSANRLEHRIDNLRASYVSVGFYELISPQVVELAGGEAVVGSHL